MIQIKKSHNIKSLIMGMYIIILSKQFPLYLYAEHTGVVVTMQKITGIPLKYNNLSNCFCNANERLDVDNVDCSYCIKTHTKANQMYTPFAPKLYYVYIGWHMKIQSSHNMDTKRAPTPGDHLFTTIFKINQMFYP